MSPLGQHPDSTRAMRMGPVKFVVPILYGPESPLEEALCEISRRFGTMDYRSVPYPFDFTAYYQPEMGIGLHRIIVSFADLIPPEDIRLIKRATDAMEDRWRLDGRRSVNLDPGYMDYFKLVLASNKAGGNKVAVGDGVWLDINLLYEKRQWKTLPWTFPDFKTGRYDRDLCAIRDRYKVQMRNLHP